MQILMVLNDGETYSDIFGCRVVIAPDNLDGEDLDEFVKDTFDEVATAAEEEVMREWAGPCKSVRDKV